MKTSTFFTPAPLPSAAAAMSLGDMVNALYKVWGYRHGLRTIDCACYLDLLEQRFGKNAVSRLFRFLADSRFVRVRNVTLDHDLFGLRVDTSNTFRPRFLGYDN